MRPAAFFILISALAAPVAAFAAETDAEREAWRAGIAAARARSEAERAALKAEFERRKAERLLHPPSAEDLAREQAQRRSEEVKSDSSLQKGDIVSTVHGLFVYRGNSQGDRTPDDFAPLPASRQR